MSDVVTLARLARESLGRGLSALQGDPHIPPHFSELAAPIAQAMGALHQIERSGGTQLMPGAQLALSNVQTALTQLQAQPSQQAAVLAAMEAVAGALGHVHALTRSAAVPQGARAPAPQAGPSPVGHGPTPYAEQPYPHAAPPQQAQPRAYPPQAAQKAQQPATAARGAAPKGDGAVVAAELGAHSQTNFYKGLSGNDIIDHGGLFVSTYKLPKIGQPVRLKVSMPGGYEFEANAVVRWCREQSEAGNDAPPGFGAQFVEITPEARQLVYRYVRNREPMFHDDL